MYEDVILIMFAFLMALFMMIIILIKDFGLGFDDD